MTGRIPAARSSLSTGVVLMVGLSTCAGCGQKGPPLPPLLVVPAAASDFAAMRVSHQTHLRMTVPSANVDGSKPADLDRIEIYAVVGPRKPDTPFLKQAKLVGSIEVRRPTPEGETASSAQTESNAKAGVEQGQRAVLVDDLSSIFSAGGAGHERPPFKEYIAFGVSRRGRFGAPSTPLIVPLGPAPPPPGAVELSFTAEVVELSWSPVTRTLKPVQEPATEGMLPSTPIPKPPLPFKYNVYAATGGNVAAGASPVNAEPLSDPAFADRPIQFGTERCYAVRTVEQVQGVSLVESEASTIECVVPIDIFPPAAPKELNAAATPGAVNLIWQPNSESDLAGYIVLRTEASGGELRPIMFEPIRESAFRDTNVQPGVRYIYAVAAVDMAKPPNLSPHSNRIEMTAR